MAPASSAALTLLLACLAGLLVLSGAGAATATGDTPPTGGANADGHTNADGHISAADTSAGDTTAAGDGSVENFEFARWSTEWLVGLEQTPGGEDRSYAEVTETIVPVFPEYDQNRGIVRSVPLDIADDRMSVSEVAVHDEAGNDIEFSSEVSGNTLTVEIGGEEYVHGEQTYVLSYTLHDVIADLGNPEAQELYANLLPTSRSQPIGAFSASVTLAPELAEAIVGEASCYIGEIGSTEACELVVDGRSYLVDAGAMPANETLTVNIGVAPGTVPELTLLDRVGWFPFLIAALPPIGAVVSILLLVRQWSRSRHPRGGIVVAQYEPRADLSPHLVARLLPALATQAFPAGILYAAVHGALQIEESDAESKRTSSSERSGVRNPNLRRPASTSPLPAIEQRFVDDVLFRGETVVSLSGNENIGKAYTEFGEDTKAAAIDAGFLAPSQDAERSKHRTLSVSLVSLFIAIAALVVTVIADGGVLIGISVAALAVLAAVVILSALLPTVLRTAEGTEARDHLRGLREYIRLSEADRIRVLQSAETAERVDGAAEADSEAGAEADSEADSRTQAHVIEVYERLLPYAVLFGLDRTWAKELQAQYESSATAPDWLWGYQAVMFSAAISRVKETAQTALPDAASGGAATSGFAGGGSAGGGVGGGSVGGR